MELRPNMRSHYEIVIFSWYSVQHLGFPSCFLTLIRNVRVILTFRACSIYCLHAIYKALCRSGQEHCFQLCVNVLGSYEDI
jgi:hypothetical protein